MLSINYHHGGPIVREELPKIETEQAIRQLGYHTDTSGVRWHVQCIIQDIVYAVKEHELIDYYSTTDARTWSLVSQEWHAYLNVLPSK